MGRRTAELQRIRAELDHLVSIRFTTGLTLTQRQRYDSLADREVELLAAEHRRSRSASAQFELHDLAAGVEG